VTWSGCGRRRRPPRRALRAKDDFLAVLSHELRTPLTPVLAATSALEARTDLPADLREEVGLIRRNVEHEARLIDDLLALTDLLRGEARLHMEAVDAHAALLACLESRRAEIDARRLAVTTDLGAERPLVWADPARLRQVLGNLVDNAVQYTPEGGEVAVRSSGGEDGRLAVRVEDTGVGSPRRRCRGFSTPSSRPIARCEGAGAGWAWG
jgi:signal transduction histidine kinase